MFYENVLKIALLVIPLSIGVYYLWILFEEKILNKLINTKGMEVQYAQLGVSLEKESLFDLYEKMIEKFTDLETKFFEQLYNNEKINEEMFNALSQKLDFLDSKIDLLSSKIERIPGAAPSKTIDRRLSPPFFVR